MQVGLGPGHTVLDGDPSPPPLKGDRAPQFSAHICCSQMAGWIEMPIGMEVGLSPLYLPKMGAEPPPQFSAISIVVKRLQYRCMHQDATWYGGRP